MSKLSITDVKNATTKHFTKSDGKQKKVRKGNNSKRAKKR